jgi:hypothetical protein
MRLCLMTALAAASLALLACGSGDDSATTDSGGGHDSTTNTDAGKDSTTGDAAKDVATDRSTTDTTSDTPTDTPTDSPAADTGACSTVSAKDCMKCCDMAFKKGAKELIAAELACACTKDVDGGVAPTLCGPPQTKVDSGALGVGACSAAQCGGDAGALDKDCNECLREATGTMKKPGECYTAVAATCTDAGGECVDYVECLAGCK